MRRTRGLWLALRSRGIALLLLVACGQVVLLATIGDRSYLFRSSSSTQSREVFAAEIVGVLAAVCLPALWVPQLCDWECIRKRWEVRVISMLLAVVGIALVANTHWLMSHVLAGMQDTRPYVTAFNALTLGAISSVATLFGNRRLGPLLGMAMYCFGVAAQSTSVGSPFPLVENPEHWIGWSVGFLSLVGVLSGFTLGRPRSRWLDE